MTDFCDRRLFCAERETKDELMTLILALKHSELEPKLKERFEARVVYPGSSVGLKCSAVGSPMPQIRWFFYSQSLSDSSSTQNSGHADLMSWSRVRIADYVTESGDIVSHLNLSSIRTQDSGLYSCLATSDNWTAGHSQMIQVYGPPIVHPLPNMTLVVGSKTQIDCPVSGYPVTHIKWTRGSSPARVSSCTRNSL
jgi:Down syndrome cell adhesion protein